MIRPARFLLLALVASSMAAPAARVEPQEAPPVEAPPAPPPPASPPPHDPLEEFVPKEKVKADSIVSLPVDI